jgi:hypothetical protein
MPSANTTPPPRTCEAISPQPLEEPSFPLFPYLPLEIRRKIWTATLPRPRGINLATPLSLHQKGAQHPYPIALHLSRESRHLVLCHYIILCHYVKDRLSWPSFAVLPLCFDPACDSLIVHIKPLFYSDLKNVARTLLEKTPKLFSKITRLKIQIFLRDGYDRSTIWSHGTVDVLSGRDLLVGMLRYMHNLERVEILVNQERMQWYGAHGEISAPWGPGWEMGTYRAHVKKFFEALKKANPAYKIPQIELWDQEWCFRLG